MRAPRHASSLLLAFAMSACQASTDASPSLTRVEGLGSISFENSGSAGAQEPFTRGVLLLHSFEFDRAAQAFRQAQEADPDFALAYWGEAMTYNHPLWREQDRDAALDALARLAGRPAERRRMAGTEREAMYLDAIEALYGEGEKTPRDIAYMGAMRRLAEAYPEDHEARAFYSLSILGSKGGSRDFATYVRAAAVAQPLFEANRDHPGAAHYLIHSFDDPVHAPLGLPAANAYSEIAPDAAHAQHMTTHIFVAMGQWDRVIANNIRAMSAQDAGRADRGLGPNACGHYSSWLHYGYLQAGQLSEAETLMDACDGRMSEDPSGGEVGYFVSMRARHLMDTEDWGLANRWTLGGASGPADLLTVDRITTAMAALKSGDASLARELVDRSTARQASVRLEITQLKGLLAIHDGRADQGIAWLREAAETEDALPFEFGPPRTAKPTYEALGEALLSLGRTEEAAAAFGRAVERTPGRTLAVRGLERSGA
jgi:Tetratricopeptide repeat